MHRVSDGWIHAKNLSSLLLAHQIHFVGNDQGGQTLFFSNDQEAVQHAQMGRRVGTGEDEYSLVRIGEQDLLVYPLRPRVEPHQAPAARFDRFNTACSVRLAGHLHPVTHCGNIRNVPALLEAAAQMAGERPIIRLDDEETGLGAQDGSGDGCACHGLLATVHSMLEYRPFGLNSYGSGVGVGSGRP